MEIRRLAKLLLLILFSLNAKVFAQTSTGKCCQNELSNKIDFRAKSNKLYVESMIKKDSICFKIVNTTSDTLFLFKSYFRKQLYSSKYIHRIDEMNKIFNISFVPLISNLTTIRSDKLIIGENSINNKNQILYDFVKLNPNTYFKLAICLNDLFKNIHKAKNAVKKIDEHSLSKFSQIQFNELSTNKLRGKYQLVFSFGIYKSVNLLCKQSNYFLKEFEFNKQAKSFKIIE